MNRNYILKGDIVYSLNRTTLRECPDSYLVCADGKSAGVYRSPDDIPEAYQKFPVEDFSGHLIVPGLYDLHIHAPQYQFRGLWMDVELLDWLNLHAFPNEAKYEELAFAQKAYRMFTNDMRKGATARFSAFATLHTDATLLLADLIEESGLCAYIGKVNMDRNSPSYLCETTEESARETRRYLETLLKKGVSHVRPILTPRFIPSCTDDLMRELGKIIAQSAAAADSGILPLQSHLSENKSEIEWVSALCPWSAFYGDAYDKAGCFGGTGSPTIMAHCVWSGKQERELMKRNGVYIAHCPSSNMNVSSGIAPVRAYLEEGQRVGLGTDVAGGSSGCMFRAVTDAIQVSKLYWRLVDQSAKQLTFPEAFFLATVSGGSFFGRCGSFEPGFAFDALVLDESQIRTPLEELAPAERLERFAYLAGDRDILHKAVDGEMLF